MVSLVIDCLQALPSPKEGCTWVTVESTGMTLIVPVDLVTVAGLTFGIAPKAAVFFYAGVGT